MGETPAWKPLINLCSLLTTFQEEKPKTFKTKSNAETNEVLKKYADCTDRLLEGIVRVVEEISNEFIKEKSCRESLQKDAEVISNNQNATKAASILKDCKADLLESTHTFTIHDVNYSLLPELEENKKFHTKTQLADFLKIPKDMQQQCNISSFKKKNSEKSTFIVRCDELKNKIELEKIVRASFKTSVNLPKYLYAFVKKIRPRYVELGRKLKVVNCEAPYIMIRPNREGDKLVVFAKDISQTDAKWNFVENLSLPYPNDIISSGNISQICSSNFLDEDIINAAIPDTFLF